MMSADELLQQEWESFGRPDGYVAPDEQEVADLSDPRNRKRGEKTQRKRLKRSRQQLERERLAEQRQVQATEGAALLTALPTYLLGRGDGDAERQASAQAASSGEESSGKEEDDPDRKAERQHERRVDRWSSDAVAQDARWQREQDAAKSQRVSQAALWDAAHGDERDAQHAALTAEQPDVYWALAHEIGRRPKWRLRKGQNLEADATSVAAHDEPLLLYRAFHRFDGNVVKALQVLSGPLLDAELISWLDGERAKLPGPPEASRPSQPCCPDCGQPDCTCLRGDDPRRTDPYAHGGSADSHYIGTGDHDRLERHEKYDRLVRELLQKGLHGPLRVGAPTEEVDEMAEERALDEDARRSAFYSVPAGDLPTSAIAPREWDASQERQRQQRACDAGPPPLRDDPRYGPRANNRAGDDRFRADRAMWYESIMDEPLPDNACAWELCDAVARRYRNDNTRSGRPGRSEQWQPAPVPVPVPVPAPIAAAHDLPITYRSSIRAPLLGSPGWKDVLRPLSEVELRVWKSILVAEREEMDASGLARMAKLRPQNEVGIELYRCEMGMFYIDSELKRRA